jgi:hypothetical protein
MSSLQKRLIKNKKLKSYKKLQIALRKAKQKPGAPALWMYCYEELEKRSPWPPASRRPMVKDKKWSPV